MQKLPWDSERGLAIWQMFSDDKKSNLLIQNDKIIWASLGIDTLNQVQVKRSNWRLIKSD